jgi:hypothetical protein
MQRRCASDEQRGPAGRARRLPPSSRPVPSPQSPEVQKMAEAKTQHAHAGAEYTLSQTAESFGVDVTIPGMAPVNIRGFATQADAELWVAKHRVTVAAGPARRRVPFRSRPLVKAE